MRLEKWYAGNSAWREYMNCELYKKKKDINGSYYVLVRDRPLVSNLSADVVKAILLLLDGYFRTEEIINLEYFVKKIEEKKWAGALSMPPDFYADNEEGLSPHDFFKACNVLEYILGFSQGLGKYIPLDIFAVKFG